jgi:hypothetical protein
MMAAAADDLLGVDAPEELSAPACGRAGARARHGLAG